MGESIMVWTSVGIRICAARAISTFTAVLCLGALCFSFGAFADQSPTTRRAGIDLGSIAENYLLFQNSPQFLTQLSFADASPEEQIFVRNFLKNEKVASLPSVHERAGKFEIGLGTRTVTLEPIAFNAQTYLINGQLYQGSAGKIEDRITKLQKILDHKASARGAWFFIDEAQAQSSDPTATHVVIATKTLRAVAIQQKPAHVSASSIIHSYVERVFFSLQDCRDILKLTVPKGFETTDLNEFNEHAKREPAQFLSSSSAVLENAKLKLDHDLLEYRNECIGSNVGNFSNSVCQSLRDHFECYDDSISHISAAAGPGLADQKVAEADRERFNRDLRATDKDSSTFHRLAPYNPATYYPAYLNGKPHPGAK
jgi:hypothetical protein